MAEMWTLLESGIQSGTGSVGLNESVGRPKFSGGLV